MRNFLASELSVCGRRGQADGMQMVPSHPDFRMASYAPWYGHFLVVDRSMYPYHARKASRKVNPVCTVLSHTSLYISSPSSSTNLALSSLLFGKSIIKGVEVIIFSKLSQTIHHDVLKRLAA